MCSAPPYPTSKDRWEYFHLTWETSELQTGLDKHLVRMLKPSKFILHIYKSCSRIIKSIKKPFFCDIRDAMSIKNKMNAMCYKLSLKLWKLQLIWHRTRATDGPLTDCSNRPALPASRRALLARLHCHSHQQDSSHEWVSEKMTHKSLSSSVFRNDISNSSQNQTELV